MDIMAETRTSITVRPDLSDYRGLLKALNQMDKEAQFELKNDVYSLSAWTAQGIERAGFAHPIYPKQAAIVARTVRPARDRVPTVYVGGGKGRASGGANAGQLLFGNEFGGDRNAFGNLNAFRNGGYRFPPRTSREGRGNTGYWIFPTLKGMQPEIKKRWFAAVNRVMDNWARYS
jgi:hypothetical protein